MPLLPTKELLNEIQARNQIKHQDQVDLRLEEIGVMMIAASKKCIRFVRLPRDEPFIHEFKRALQNDGYAVRREYMHLESGTSVGPYDEFVGWIITW